MAVILLPMLLVIGLYVALDPFKVVHEYENYAYPEPEYLRPTINKGMISLKNFERNYPQEHYNSFVFGSSMSIPYTLEHWKEYLPEDAVPFHFDSSSESPRSLLLKMQYLTDRGVKIDNALIVVHPWWTGWEDIIMPPYINRPEIDPEVSWLEYHLLYLRAFVNRDFFFNYITSHIIDVNLNVIDDNIYDGKPFIVNPITNEETVPLWDDSVANHTKEFYALRRGKFERPRVPQMLPSGLAKVPGNATVIDSIAALLARHGTDYQVIIGPTLYKEHTSDEDLAHLRRAFGDRLHDFSASMDYKADVDTNFTDDIHYRRHVAAEMLDSAYSHKRNF